MRLLLFLLILANPFISICQSTSHIVFGVNMNADWYSLTNYSGITYDSSIEENPKSEYVTVDFEYSYNKIDKEFLDIGFDELLLSFPKSENRSLKVLSPSILIGRIKYSDLGLYKKNSKADIERILTLTKKTYGEPVLNMLKDKFTIYKWETATYSIILTCREEDLTTSFYYAK